MKKKIFCKFLNKKSEKQKFQIYPGELGKFILENISQEAWEIWQKKQTIIINENKLNMINIQDRKFLEKEMQLFFFGKELYTNK